MPLPLLRRCCGCLSLRTGCFILCIMSTPLCIMAAVTLSLDPVTPAQKEKKTGRPNNLNDKLIMACAANIAAGAWNLPRHREREPEDNLISMSMVMFSTLSAISNLIALFGIILKRPSKLQLSLVFNSVFIFCIFLVAIVTCLFRLDDFLRVPGNIVLIVFLLIAGAVYSLYYLTMINSLYRIMKMAYGESAIPV